MTSPIYPISRRRVYRALAGVLFTAFLALGVTPLRGGDTSALQIGINPTSSVNEFTRSAFLTWTAQPGYVYKVQSRATLDAGTPWVTDEPVQATSTTMKWMAPQGLGARRYYQLLLPQPAIFNVEPAIIAPGAAMDIYVLGQLFDSNVVLSVNGVTQTNAVVQSSTVIERPSFVPGTPGSYQFSVAVGGVVVSSFTVTCADVSVTPELALQGPPGQPPAGPSLYRARGTKSRSNIQNNRASGGGGGAFGNSGTVLATGKVIKSRSNVQNNFTAGGGDPDHDEDGNDFADARTGDDCDDHDPNIHPWSGEVVQQVVDLAVAGRGLDFVWARTYRSRTGRFDAYGSTWTTSYDVHCSQNSSGGVDVYDGTGRKDTFALQAAGVYTCPQFFREGVFTNGSFRLTFADTGYWQFNAFDGSATGGRLSQIVDRNGNTMSLSYDGSGRLVQIVDDLGRTNTVAYNTDGLVSTVTDFSGRSVNYQYYHGLAGENGGLGDLASVTSPAVTGTPDGNDFPSGKTTTYTYTTGNASAAQNHLLLSITNPKGQLAWQFAYDLNPKDFNFLACTGAQEGSTLPERITILPQVASPANSFAVTRCVVNDPVGNVTEYFCDARGRCVLERDYTGRATPGLEVTDSVNRPTGKLRSSDPDYYDTSCAWNNDSLCTRLTLPGGNALACVYQGDFDSSTSARKRGDLRIVHSLASGAGADTDGDGVPDTTELTTTFQYDPRFGNDSPPGGEVIASTRQRVIDLETRLMNLGLLTRSSGIRRVKFDMYMESLASRGSSSSSRLLPTVNKRTGESTIMDPFPDPPNCVLAYHAINTKGTGTAGRLLPTVNKRSGLAPELFFDGYESGGRAMYVNPRSIARQQFFFSESSRIRPRGWDGTIKGRIAAEGNGMAIKTKGTGADKNRTIVLGDLNRDGVLDFAVACTDARGMVSTASYDGQGNLKSCDVPMPVITIDPSVELDFTYNTHGQLTAVTNPADANGRRGVDTYSYFSSGAQTGYLQQCVADANGLALTTTCECDARGNVTRCIDPRGNDALYTYNSLDQCVRMQSPTNVNARCVTDYTYDANDNLTQCAVDVRDDTDTKLSTRTTVYGYDQENRLVRVTEPISGSSSAVTGFTYDDDNELTAISSPLASLGLDSHEIQAFTYDERGLLFTATAAPGTGLCGTNIFSYTANLGAATKQYVDAGDAMITSCAYDGFDRPVSLTDAMGNVVTCAFDRNGNLIHARADAEGVDVPGSAGNHRFAECRWQYDPMDRCVQSSEAFFDPATQSPIDKGTAVSTCAYAPNGECVRVTDSLGNATTFTYDTACRLTGVMDPRGNTRVCVVNACGDVTSVTATDQSDLAGGPQTFSATCVYDHWDRCVSSSDNVGNTRACAYDSLGRVIRDTDADGNDTTHTYDLLDNCLSTTCYTGSSFLQPASVISSSHTAYDVSSRCVAFTDANGNTTSLGYDSVDRCVAVTNANGTTRRLVWSPRSNVIGEQDANTTTVSNIYDHCDRVLHRDIACRGPAVSTTSSETFAYDGCSRLVLASNDVSVLTFSYDSMGNCTSGSQDGLVESATHDTEGNMLSCTYPGGRLVTCSYDALNRATNVTTTGGGVSHPQLARFAYVGPDRVAAIARDNGVNTRVDWDGQVNPANAAGDYGWQDASRVRHGTAAAPSLIADLSGTYRRFHSMTSESDAVTTRSATLAYDAMERLVSSSVSIGGVPQLATVYVLDAFGNRQQVLTNGVAMPDYTMSSALPPGDFEMNRYTSTPFGLQQYDANGNLVARDDPTGVTFFHYDYADRLVEVDALGGLGTIAPVATFTYDALGGRISKTTYPPSPALPVTTQYVNDSVEYRDPEDMNTRTRIETRQSGAPVDSYVHKLDDGVNIARFDASGQPQFCLLNDRGNTIALTDGQGRILERCAYDDYGGPQFLAANGTPLVDGTGAPLTASPSGNPFLFHGMEWDSETGLYYEPGMSGVNPLYEDPRTGRCLSVRGDCVSGACSSLFDGNNPWSACRPKSTEVCGNGFCDAIEPRNILKTFFETGDIPTQEQFSTLIDSTVNRITDRYLLGLSGGGGGGSAYRTGHHYIGHVTIVK